MVDSQCDICDPSLSSGGVDKLMTLPKSDGTMSQFFIATVNGRQYFMKRLKPEFAGNHILCNAYRKEWELGSTISHPNIVKYERFEDDEFGCYILMENVCGETLAERMKSKPRYFAQRQNLDRFFLQLLSALNCLHERKIVYSDLKPENVMITQVGNDVKVVDLGFCFTDAYSNTVGMTHKYAAPEHCDVSQIDERTDIYGVGRLIEYIGQYVKLPRVYRKIQEKCLKKQKCDRFQCINEIVRLIDCRTHYVGYFVLACVVVLVLYFAWRIAQHSERFMSWWDSFELFEDDVVYDFEQDHIYYQISSPNELICRVVGATSLPNIRIPEEVKFNSHTYRVTEIADSSFIRRQSIKSIYIQYGLE